jgi:hypothetical protein
VRDEREYVDNLLLLDLELNGWFFELEILDQFEIGTSSGWRVLINTVCL